MFRTKASLLLQTIKVIVKLHDALTMLNHIMTNKRNLRETLALD